MKERQIQLQVEMLEEKIQRLKLQKEFYEKLINSNRKEN
jgi:hypothetical protein